MFYLGGHTITKTGWAGPNAVRVVFVSQYTSGWVWQLYAGRKRIGSTLVPSQRELIGQLFVDDAPAALTLVRVDLANRLTDYGPQLPPVPWHRYRLDWQASSFPADTSRFVVTASRDADGEVDETNILAEPAFVGDGSYAYLLPPLAKSGEWTYRVTPRDNAKPLGNAGTPANVTIAATVPPADVRPGGNGQRFSIAVEGNQLIVGFAYGGPA